MLTPRARRLLCAGLLFSGISLFLSPITPRVAGGADSATPDAVRPLLAEQPLKARAAMLDSLGVAAWHRDGQRGAGVKVAVLDSGFRGYRAYLGGALPSHVLARSFRADHNLEAKDSQHGILCGEVVHALAPSADLLFANWEPDRPDQFLEAVRWARNEGARIITCSVIMPSWSDGEGHGEVHRDLSRALGNGTATGDVLCFASAGNTAQRHWSGAFHDDGNGCHAWAPGRTENGVRPWGSERVSVELCAAAGGCFQVALEDATAGREVGRGMTTAAKSSAVVRFTPEEGHAYRLRVRGEPAAAPFFHLVVLGGGLDCATARGSIPFPGDGPEVIAVGAVDADGQRLSYSSCGPNSERPKPDFVAPVPFPSLWRARPFSGTSAASPQAAALAALLWGKHPNWTAGQVRRALETSAVDLGPKGHDCETGYGRVHLP